MFKNKLSIVWFRRNLRLEDNKSLAHALSNSERILPIFIFDSSILKRFLNPYDRRLSFLANTLCNLNNQLKEKNGEFLVLHGNPIDIIPKLASLIKADSIYADEDYEPENIKRDNSIKERLSDGTKLELFCDHLLIHPDKILTKTNQPYKVYTPYMQAFRSYLSNQDNLNLFVNDKSVHNELFTEYSCNLENKLALADNVNLKEVGVERIYLEHSESDVLKQIGYIYQEDKLWSVKNANDKFTDFISKKINNYNTNRDFLNIGGTSALSPYLRFGLISIRKCYRETYNLLSNPGITTWINELIWREFYASILYHFPNIVTEEFQEKYRNKIEWNKDQALFQKFTEAKTGYPIIDAAIRQLIQDGWMHNRARMIVASFFTKNLLLDWRLGEEFFAQYLMDYDLASNNGGWQWASSCGTDAQPYFRIFNPFTQGKNFDPEAKYIKKYLPELAKIDAKLIHNPNFTEIYLDYPKPIIDYSLSRIRALEVFKQVA